MSNLTYLLTLGSCLAGEVILYIVFLIYCTTEWYNYYAVYCMTPIVVCRIVLGGLAGLSYTPEWHQRKVRLLGFFWSSNYGMLARYMQSALAAFLILMLLNIRPIYLAGEVHGWGNAPCGASSCTRSDSLDLMNAIPFAVYNPRGWFPRGENERYDEQGTTQYVFCNYGDQCRWNDYEDREIRSYEKLTGGCELNYDAPVRYEKGYASRRGRDYTDGGKGILGGWSPCKRVGQSYPCRGVSTQNTEALMNSTTSATFHDDGSVEINEQTTYETLQGETGRKHFKGKHVCAVCALYQNTYKTLFGGVDGTPEFKDPDVECVPNSDESVNAWCFICPGESGAFGSPFNKFNAESVKKSDLRDSMVYSIVVAAYPLLTLVMMYAYFSLKYRPYQAMPTAEPVLEVAMVIPTKWS